MGDFNARTSNLADTLNYDAFLDHDNQLSYIENIMTRVSHDHVIDQAGSRLIDFCKTSSLLIDNGRLYYDAGIGEYTYHSMNGSSVVDYLLLDYNDLDCSTHFCILLPNSFSDRCGIEVNLATKNRLENNRKTY